MNARTWIILGATSIIAEEFAHFAANAGNRLILVGRNTGQLAIIAADIRLRYKVDCDFIFADFSNDSAQLMQILLRDTGEVDLFIAYSSIIENCGLTQENISQLIRVNIESTAQFIHAYINKQQIEHHLVFLSSVAACRGRAKNSLYGGSKAAIEIYLEGLQQSARPNVHITIARLGFIDTAQTFGSPGIFYASPPKTCAKACWRAAIAQKRLIYHPFFWRFIMGVIRWLPFPLYKKLKL
ncbi:SDR family NAD(P)-dependent oxidoreductase [Legionella micdadei]|uniref:Short chain dehydrogenase n=2 Tax=Legionella micdadei TaxID=451 RepID=A0A098GFZ3_LEGMI|nr:SDR family NAD(P)-dependent oxidoreductase [Legionella micdadei]ARG97972.1 short-chain dehydrogenase [Legionella micdadei]KTD30231.1 oxidoreductase [Legionella micdadei]NSL19227.1 SDR family NAD(P)-dependent oxidoreductase [Legionella micdadei]CEG60406.1 oxidoreductase, short chain dehydrogenase/reductase family [Legionella micdadei]SCY72083.1 short chain dehydrogenase [Legionella micdadei]